VTVVTGSGVSSDTDKHMPAGGFTWREHVCSTLGLRQQLKSVDTTTPSPCASTSVRGESFAKTASL